MLYTYAYVVGTCTNETAYQCPMYGWWDEGATMILKDGLMEVH